MVDGTKRIKRPDTADEPEQEQESELYGETKSDLDKVVVVRDPSSNKSSVKCCFDFECKASRWVVVFCRLACASDLSSELSCRAITRDDVDDSDDDKEQTCFGRAGPSRTCRYVCVCVCVFCLSGRPTDRPADEASVEQWAMVACQRGANAFDRSIMKATEATVEE